MVRLYGYMIFRQLFRIVRNFYRRHPWWVGVDFLLLALAVWQAYEYLGG